MNKLLSLIILFSALGVFVVFYRRKLNVVLIGILLVYGLGSLQRLLTMDDTESLPAVGITIGGLAVIWLVTWLGVRYRERRRDDRR